MLVLSRKKDETIVVNDNIYITIVDIRGDKIRVGINAPPEVAIHREELSKKPVDTTLASETSEIRS
jgi:carbon storage regulator